MSTASTMATNKMYNASLATASATSNKQLVELAAEQKYINYHLCLFHYQFIRLLYFLIKYNIKPVRALAFYDTKVSTCLAISTSIKPQVLKIKSLQG
jgi:hypothetical protein